MCKIIKQNVLPRILYKMQTLPIAIPFLKRIKKLIYEFVWANKTPRLSGNILIRSKAKGGLALSDISNYYVAVHLARILKWCNSRKINNGWRWNNLLYLRLCHVYRGYPLHLYN